MQLDAALQIISTNDQVIMNMLSVNMCSNQHFTIAEAFRKLHADLTRFLRCDLLADPERLHVMIEPHAVRLVSEHILFVFCPINLPLS